MSIWRLLPRTPLALLPVRFWRGERDSRGDSNWVPAEMVERIEVIRGPAAARYGSGAIFWPHAANVDLAIITAYPVSAVTGQVNARHFANDG
jgi:outer membrane receptor for ferrienterochelin and colicin